MSEVKGQAQVKRALEIAAAGGHSVLMMGPPGTGKSMLAARFPGILPQMSETEALQSAALQSLDGGFDVTKWKTRPYRAPHHTASGVALVGGGSNPRPAKSRWPFMAYFFSTSCRSLIAVCWKYYANPWSRGTSPFHALRAAPISRRSSSSSPR